MKNMRKEVIGAAFGLASLGMIGTANAECCADPLRAKPEDLTYRTLGSAGIRLPTYNQKLLEDGRVQFDLRRQDINALRYAFSRTMGLYGHNSAPGKHQLCPYINVPDKYFTKQYMNNGTIRVTMAMSRDVLEVVARQGCVITDTPAP